MVLVGMTAALHDRLIADRHTISSRGQHSTWIMWGAVIVSVIQVVMLILERRPIMLPEFDKRISQTAQTCIHQTYNRLVATQ